MNFYQPAVQWATAHWHYMIQWAAGMVAVIGGFALLTFAPQLLMLAFAVALAVAGATQINQREFFNAGIAFGAAFFVFVVSYFTPL